MGNVIKLISGIILFILGILLIYETYLNNLVDLILFAGFITSILGFILIVSYFVDSSADKIGNVLNDFAKSNNSSIKSIHLNEKSSSGSFTNPFKSKKSSNIASSNGPLKVRNDNLEDESGLKKLYHDDFNRGYEENSYLERVKDIETPINTEVSVLDAVDERSDFDLDKKLNFTPNYDRPLKVTRKPKKREKEFFDDKYIYYGDVEDKTEDIAKALQEEEEKVIIPQQNITPPVSVEPEPSTAKEIKIDLNDPESLPIPKLLKSFVISNSEIVTSQEAFELLVSNVHKEVLLEISNLNGLSEQFLSNIPSLYSRIIIEDFALSDLSNLVVISSLMKEGVHIRTIPKVNTINLITDDSYALIMAETTASDIEYGAIYTDRDSISEIRSSFETIWNMANQVDQNSIIQQVNGGV